MAESFPSPPSYENVMLEDVQKWNLPEEFHQAIQSFIQWPLDPPKNPYRTYFRFTDPISGSIYVGECDSKRRKYGYGHCRFENGDLYHGLWKKDQMDEFGCYWWSNTGSIYVGHWKKGQRHGLGTFLFGPLHKSKPAGELQTSQWVYDVAGKPLKIMMTKTVND